MLDAIALVAVVIILVATVIRPLVGLYAFIVLSILNLYTVFPIIGRAHLTQVIAALALVMYFVKPPREPCVMTAPRVLLFLLFLVYAASAAAAGNQVHAQEYMVTLTKNVLFCWMTISMVRSWKSLDVLLQILLVMVVINVVIALVLQAQTGAAEAAGVYGQRSNVLAVSLAPMIPIGYYYLFRRGRTLQQGFGGLAIGAILAGLVMTFSRTGFLAMVAAWTFTLGRRLGRATTYLLVVAMVVAAVVWVPQTYVEKVKSIRTADDSSARGRQTVMRRGVEMFLDHPMLGVGPGNFPDALQVKVLRAQRTLKHAHNQFIETAAETGIGGLVLLVTLVWYAVRSVMRARYLTLCKPTADEEDLRQALLASWVAVVVGMLFISTSNNRFVWLILALPVCFLQARRNAELLRGEEPTMQTAGDESSTEEGVLSPPVRQM